MVKPFASEYKIGERVLYDVFPTGANLEGIVGEGGIKTVGVAAQLMARDDLSDFCEWEHVHDVRPHPEAMRDALENLYSLCGSEPDPEWEPEALEAFQGAERTLRQAGGYTS
jgi:hypothetical protein